MAAVSKSPVSADALRPAGAAASGREEPLVLDEHGLPVLRKPLGEPVIRLRGVSKSYELEGGERVPALRQINLCEGEDFYPIRRGEFVMIRGPSGGGKTTLLNLIGTIDTPTTGVLDLFGTRVDFTSATDAFLADLRLQKIGFVFQTFNLLATLSAYENVELPMTVLGRMSDEEVKRRTVNLLRSVGLEDRMFHLPSEMSGGEQQRTTIARALSNNPDLLLLDEPTGDLDTKTTVEVMDLLLRINNEQRKTMVMVTHNPDLECYADRILYVADGRFVHQAINLRQTPLVYESYLKYLNQEAEGDGTEAGGRHWEEVLDDRGMVASFVDGGNVAHPERERGEDRGGRSGAGGGAGGGAGVGAGGGGDGKDSERKGIAASGTSSTPSPTTPPSASSSTSEADGAAHR